MVNNLGAPRTPPRWSTGCPATTRRARRMGRRRPDAAARPTRPRRSRADLARHVRRPAVPAPRDAAAGVAPAHHRARRDARSPLEPAPVAAVVRRAWAEASGLERVPDAEPRLERAAPVARRQRHRARDHRPRRALLTDDLDRLPELAERMAAAGCIYQAERTLPAAPRRVDGRGARSTPIDHSPPANGKCSRWSSPGGPTRRSRGPLHQPQDRRAPRVQHPHQTRRRHPRRSRHARRPTFRRRDLTRRAALQIALLAALATPPTPGELPGADASAKQSGAVSVMGRPGRGESQIRDRARPEARLRPCAPRSTRVTPEPRWWRGQPRSRFARVDGSYTLSLAIQSRPWRGQQR